MANRHKVQAFARGGKPTLSSGNAKVAAAGMKGGTNPGIKPIQKKDGGKVEGRATGGRLDKRARGGRTGGSPFSAAASKVK
jgi:hypothetical protein